MASRAPNRPRIAALLLVLAGLSLSATSIAAPPSAADKETARALMDQGDDRMEAKDYASALKAYQGADAIMHLPMTAVSVARTEEAMGLLVEARDAALGVVHAPVQSGETATYAKARAEAEAIANRLVPRIPSLQLSLSARPAGLEVTLDGAALPAAVLDVPRKVNPGKHVITARAPGYAEARLDVTLPEGATTPVPITLERAGAAGSSQPLAPVEPKVPPPDGAGLAPRATSPLVFLGFGVGGVGLVAGAITGGLSLSKTSQLAASCPAKKCAAGELATPTLLANVSNASFGLAAAGAAVGVVGIVLSRSAPAPGAVTGLALRAVVGPTNVGLIGEF